MVLCHGLIYAPPITTTADTVADRYPCRRLRKQHVILHALQDLDSVPNDDRTGQVQTGVGGVEVWGPRTSDGIRVRDLPCA